jgi:hypothetical protein
MNLLLVTHFVYQCKTWFPLFKFKLLDVEYFSFLFKCRPDSFSDYCRVEFDEVKEPHNMVLASWSSPADKQITISGEKVFLLIFT